jgi:hypothetical protein
MPTAFHVNTSSLNQHQLLATLRILSGLLMLSTPLSAESRCYAIVKKNIEVTGDEFFLADLITSDSCPALRHAASGIYLGATPLAGSVRVIDGGEVRTYFAGLEKHIGSEAPAWETANVPERVVIRRAGSGTSCRRVVEKLIATLHSSPIGMSEAEANVPLDSSNAEVDCRGAGRIPENAMLETKKMAWNAASGSWNISVRCQHASDCVPFLVRVRAGNVLSDNLARLIPYSPHAHEAATQKPLVCAGTKVTLAWEKDAIRVMVPAVALDDGVAGQAVRARITRSGYVVHAVVVSARMLRTTA